MTLTPAPSAAPDSANPTVDPSNAPVREIESAGKLLRESNGVSFVLLRVKPTDPPKIKRPLDANLAMRRFIDGIQGVA